MHGPQNVKRLPLLEFLVDLLRCFRQTLGEYLRIGYGRIFHILHNPVFRHILPSVFVD